MTSAYSPDQVSLYLECIGVPERCRHEPPTLEFLTMLHIHTISTLPYENLSLHYNPSHNISLDPQYLFRKMVTDKRGRGGFCMEIAILYNHILRALGFDAYTAGVRTRPRIEGVPKGDFPRLVRHLTPHSSYPVHIRYQFYLPLTPRLLRGHIVNIVTFADGSKYHSDVAFGGDGATKPMPLIEGLAHKNLGTQQVRLAKDWLPTQAHRVDSSKQGIYQYRNNPSQQWNSFYAFAEIEFLQPDWGVVNHWMSTHPDSNQVRNLLAVKFLRRTIASSDSNEQEIYGKKMLVNGTVKQNLGDKTEFVKACATEESRLQSLENVFSIVLSQTEKDGIQTSPLRLG